MQVVAVVAEVPQRQLTVLLVALAASPVVVAVAVERLALASWVVQVALVAQDMWRSTHGKRLRNY